MDTEYELYELECDKLFEELDLQLQTQNSQYYDKYGSTLQYFNEDTVLTEGFKNTISNTFNQLKKTTEYIYDKTKRKMAEKRANKTAHGDLKLAESIFKNPDLNKAWKFYYQKTKGTAWGYAKDPRDFAGNITRFSDWEFVNLHPDDIMKELIERIYVKKERMAKPKDLREIELWIQDKLSYDLVNSIFGVVQDAEKDLYRTAIDHIDKPRVIQDIKIRHRIMIIFLKHAVKGIEDLSKFYNRVLVELGVILKKIQSTQTINQLPKTKKSNDLATYYPRNKRR